MAVILAKEHAAHHIDPTITAVSAKDEQDHRLVHLARARSFMHPVNSVQDSAKAYEELQRLRYGGHVMFEGIEEQWKWAALAVREAMVLQICAPFEILGEIRFEAIVSELFQDLVARPEDLQRTRSQLLLARSAILRLGRRGLAFQKAAPRSFSFSWAADDVIHDTSVRLWPAYQASIPELCGSIAERNTIVGPKQ